MLGHKSGRYPLSGPGFAEAPTHTLNSRTCVGQSGVNCSKVSLGGGCRDCGSELIVLGLIAWARALSFFARHTLATGRRKDEPYLTQALPFLRGCVPSGVACGLDMKALQADCVCIVCVLCSLRASGRAPPLLPPVPPPLRLARMRQQTLPSLHRSASPHGDLSAASPQNAWMDLTRQRAAPQLLTAWIAGGPSAVSALKPWLDLSRQVCAPQLQLRAPTLPVSRSTFPARSMRREILAPRHRQPRQISLVHPTGKLPLCAVVRSANGAGEGSTRLAENIPTISKIEVGSFSNIRMFRPSIAWWQNCSRSN